MEGTLKAWWAWAQAGGLRILIILVGAFLLARVIRAVADRAAALGGEDLGALTERGKRARTLASLLRTAGTALVVAVAATMILRELGVDITPIMAGAGLAGLAIGLGAQSLIKDVLAGFFILVEDQFHVGDVIKAAGVAGQVEQITLRATMVRDLEGAVHIIPNGEIKVVSNLTKGWSRVALDVGVGYREDLDRVTKILEAVGRDLVSDPQFGKIILEPPVVLGVEALSDSHVTLRLLAKTEPFKRWDVARELRKRIKVAFDREGIEIPFPHQVVIHRTDTPAGPPGPPGAA